MFCGYSGSGDSNVEYQLSSSVYRLRAELCLLCVLYQRSSERLWQQPQSEQDNGGYCTLGNTSNTMAAVRCALKFSAKYNKTDKIK